METSTTDYNHPMTHWCALTARRAEVFAGITLFFNDPPALWNAVKHSNALHNVTFGMLAVYGVAFVVMHESTNKWLTRMIFSLAIFPVACVLSIIAMHSSVAYQWLALMNMGFFTFFALAATITYVVARHKTHRYLAT